MVEQIGVKYYVIDRTEIGQNEKEWFEEGEIKQRPTKH
jgi:hypothetical protein